MLISAALDTHMTRQWETTILQSFYLLKVRNTFFKISQKRFHRLRTQHIWKLKESNFIRRQKSTHTIRRRNKQISCIYEPIDRHQCPQNIYYIIRNIGGIQRKIKFWIGIVFPANYTDICFFSDSLLTENDIKTSACIPRLIHQREGLKTFMSQFFCQV